MEIVLLNFIRFRSICSMIEKKKRQTCYRISSLNNSRLSSLITTLSNYFLSSFSFSSSQEAIAYFPLVILISGTFASVIVKKISKSLGTKVKPLAPSFNADPFFAHTLSLGLTRAYARICFNKRN